MEGHDLRAGAVASIEGIVHPVTAARLVMERTAHVACRAVGLSFARYLGLERSPAKNVGRPTTATTATARWGEVERCDSSSA